MNLYTFNKTRTNKSNIPTPIWRNWNVEETTPAPNTMLTRRKPKQTVPTITSYHRNVKPVPRSWSNNLVERVERKYSKGLKISSKHSEDQRHAQPSKSWVQTNPHSKPSVSLKYGLFPQTRKHPSPIRNHCPSPTRLRGPNTRLWSPTRHLSSHRANIVRDRNRERNTERGDRASKANVKKEGPRAATKKGSSHYSVVSRAPPPPKLGLSDTMHLDIKPGKGRFITPPR